MWARHVEFMLSCWLAISPFVFRHAPEDTWRWVNDLACAAIVAAVALLSYRPGLEKIHLANAAAGLWLLGAGLLAPPAAAASAAPAAQNWIVVGLLLVMLGILPSHSARPPRDWQAFLERRYGPRT
jgi:hypothetical protein